MPRIPMVDVAATTGEVREHLDATAARLGVVPNFHATAANSLPYLRAQAALVGALSRGGLSARQREQLALGCAQFHGCAYCLPAHTMIATTFAGLTEPETDHARRFQATDPTEAATLAFARAVLETRGDVSDDDLAAARQAGLSDGDLGAVVAEIALNVLRNYFNRLAHTEPDPFFPDVRL